MKRRPELEDALLRLEKVCAGGGSPDLEDFARGATSFQELAELARAHLCLGWQAGRGVPLSDYLARFPGLRADRRGLADLAFEEFRQRWMHGDPVAPEAYNADYGIDVSGWVGGESVCHEPTRRRPAEGDPGLLAPTRRVAERMPVVSPSALVDSVAGPLPSPGDGFLGFHLIHELGRGAFGRVYLARQEGLAGRLVALKVSADLLEESRHLARLQHTHIVPIYSLHRSGTLHAVCMPYFGCTTLADLCKSLGQSDGLPTSGRLVVSTVQNRRSTLRGLDAAPVSAPEGEPRPPAAPSVIPPALQSLEKMAYVDAVLWIGARLAEGLHHAHERGILHLDLKPANVLLTDDGSPMLLDFNLAEDINARKLAATRAHVGGTLPYMAPEQMRAFAGGPADFDARADIYSLGLILHQLLTARPVFPSYRGTAQEVLQPMLADRLEGAPRLRPLNPLITPAVEAIVMRCLEP
ncbi:MAG: serine/threonine-protein kinase, partial [Gemmataceae bacterium]